MTSGEYFTDFFMAPFSQVKEPPQNPGRFILTGLLQCRSQASQKLIVLQLDEVDTLVGDTLISLFQKLGVAYPKDSAQFPQTVILCGVRDLRDYRIQARSEREPITGGSAFNIKAESLPLGDFMADQTRTLLLEHTFETGQIFTPEAPDLVWHLTQASPAWSISWPIRPAFVTRSGATAPSRSRRTGSTAPRSI